MPICSACQTDLPDSAQFCPNCGSAVTEQDPADSYVPHRTASPLDGPSGIGGWMILVAIGLFGITGMFLLQIISSLRYVNYIALSVYLLLFAYGIVCIVLMFKKSRLFPKLYIGLLSANFGVSLLAILRLHLAGGDVSGVWSNLGGTFAGALIWSTYMLTSKRVKNTFVK